MRHVSWRSLLALTVCAGLLAAAGCTSPGPLESRRTMIGTLKASNAQLEHEKAQLAGQVAELEANNRRLEDRVAQEEAANGELTARLDDARNLLGRQGLDPESHPSVEARTRAPRTTPAARSPRRGRKAPFAQIPGDVNASPRPENDEAESFDEAPAPRTSSNDDTYDLQSQRGGFRRWMPIANGVSEPTPRVR
jgi:outer membrane murein-binding lipoprotein Lpp